MTCAAASTTSTTLHRSGHEIASHAVGHFDGASWSAADWDEGIPLLRRHRRAMSGRTTGSPTRSSTFRRQRRDRLSRAVSAPRARASTRRCASDGFRYDTSGDRLCRRLAGEDRRRLALQPGAAEDARTRAETRCRWTTISSWRSRAARDRSAPRTRRRASRCSQTYLDYFKTNYAGNRAPLHIGHHFFDYQGGAYNEALKSFARAVCGLPEVRCVTYAKLADFMDGQNPETLAAYRKGDFRALPSRRSTWRRSGASVRDSRHPDRARAEAASSHGRE